MNVFSKLIENLKNIGNIDKALEGMNIIHSETAARYLLEGEEIQQCYGLVLDFACVTNQRLFFVEGSMSGKKRVVFLPFNKITGVSFDSGHLRGKVRITTAKHTYKLECGTQIAQRFANDVLSRTWR